MFGLLNKLATHNNVPNFKNLIKESFIVKLLPVFMN
jgi:hypothetical protein